VTASAASRISSPRPTISGMAPFQDPAATKPARLRGTNTIITLELQLLLPSHPS